MKKTALVLLVMFVLAVPAMADVAITATDEGDGVVKISYVSDANVSAFGLEISVDSGATIDVIKDYHIGDSNSGAKGYGIFLDKLTGIEIDSNGVLVGRRWGHPVVDDSAPDATGTGLGTSKIIIEMGALYEDGNQPPLDGVLCRVEVSGACELCVTGNSTRGNVVLTDAEEATLNLTNACTDVAGCDGDFDGSTLVNITDINMMITYWLDNKDFLGRVLPTNPNWDPKYELTGDSMCNITDVNKVITYWLDNKDFLGRIVCPGPGF